MISSVKFPRILDSIGVITNTDLVWSRGASRVSLDARERRLLREIRLRAEDGTAGPDLKELARASRVGQRAARRALVQLQAAGLVTERTAGRFGLTPEGHSRARRR